MPWRGVRKAVAARLIPAGVLAFLMPAGTALAQFEVKEPKVEEGAIELEATGSVDWGFEESADEEAEQTPGRATSSPSATGSPGSGSRSRSIASAR